MCNAHTLILAAGNLKSATEKRKALKVAKAMEKGKAQPHDIAWAKRVTASIRTSHRSHAS